MRISEVIKIDSSQSLVETIINAEVPKIESMYAMFSCVTSNFAIKPKKLYSKQTIAEFVNGILSFKQKVQGSQQVLPQTMALLEDLLQYFDS